MAGGSSAAISMTQALNLFNRLLASPSPRLAIRPFNRILTAVTRTNTNPLHTAFALFERLNRAQGIRPDERTYQIMMDCCLRSNQVRLGFALLGRFLKEELQPNAGIFNPLLKGLFHEKHVVKAALMLLDKMPKVGCVPDVVSYNIVILGLCSHGQNASALQLFLKMIKSGGGYEPDVITYDALISGLLKGGDVSEAFGLFKLISAMFSKGYWPSVITYTAVIDALCKKGEIEKAKELMSDMISKGHRPHVPTYTTIVDALCKKGETEEAEDLISAMIVEGYRPDVITYNIVIDALCKKGEFEKAKELTSAMVSKGYKPDMVTFNIVKNALRKKGGGSKP